jgi:hypothetical protein
LKNDSKYDLNLFIYYPINPTDSFMCKSGTSTLIHLAEGISLNCEDEWDDNIPDSVLITVKNNSSLLVKKILKIQRIGNLSLSIAVLMVIVLRKQFLILVTGI